MPDPFDLQAYVDATHDQRLAMIRATPLDVFNAALEAAPSALRLRALHLTIDTLTPIVSRGAA